MPDTSPSSAPRRRSARLAPSWGAVVWVAALLSSATAFVARRLPRIERSERGDIAAGLAWALLGVVAAVAIWGVLQALGIDIVGEIRDQLGL